LAKDILKAPAKPLIAVLSRFYHNQKALVIIFGIAVAFATAEKWQHLDE